MSETLNYTYVKILKNVAIDADPDDEACQFGLCVAAFVNEAGAGTDEKYNCRFFERVDFHAFGDVPAYPSFGASAYLVTMVDIQPDDQLFVYYGSENMYPRFGYACKENKEANIRDPPRFEDTDKRIMSLKKRKDRHVLFTESPDDWGLLDDAELAQRRMERCALLRSFLSELTKLRDKASDRPSGALRAASAFLGKSVAGALLLSRRNCPAHVSRVGFDLKWFVTQFDPWSLGPSTTAALFELLWREGSYIDDWESNARAEDETMNVFDDLADIEYPHVNPLDLFLRTFTANDSTPSYLVEACKMLLSSAYVDRLSADDRAVGAYAVLHACTYNAETPNAHSEAAACALCRLCTERPSQFENVERFPALEDEYYSRLNRPFDSIARSLATGADFDCTLALPLLSKNGALRELWRCDRTRAGVSALRDRLRWEVLLRAERDIPLGARHRHHGDERSYVLDAYWLSGVCTDHDNDVPDMSAIQKGDLFYSVPRAHSWPGAVHWHPYHCQVSHINDDGVPFLYYPHTQDVLPITQEWLDARAGAMPWCMRMTTRYFFAIIDKASAAATVS